MTTRYDHPDSAAVRAEAARERPANEDTRAGDARLAKRYDHPDSRHGREPVKARSPATTSAARLARRYDHADSQAVRDERPQGNPQVAREQARTAKRYDHPSSQEGREPVSSEGAEDGEDRPAGVAGDEGARTIRAPDGFDSDDPIFRDFAKTAAELGLDQKGAERILALQRRAEALRAAHFQSQRDAWHAELEADAEVVQHLDAVREFLHEHASEDVQRLVTETWLGSHPGLVRMFVSAGRKMKEARR